MEDRMLSDEILLGIINSKSGGGGGGGTNNYNDLSNQPQINGNTLVGNKSASDLGLVDSNTVEGILNGQTIDSFGDVETALAGKQNALTAGNNIKIDNDTISVNRWAVPAGKVVYTVITSDENYGRNVHVQRHTLGGALIDDRTFLCEMYKTVNVDNLISIYNPYASLNITLLKDSDEHQSGYSYTVNPITTPTSNSFTFMMEQEENDNDLIIREELDAVSDAVDAIKDGQSIDSFADVETALALKQDATDNNLETTSKTVVGAVNELKSGLTNYQAQNDLNLEVPDRKNFIPMTVANLKALNTAGSWTGNVFTMNGIDFTVQVDGSGNVTGIKVEGTASATTYFTLCFNLSHGDSVLNGCPADGSVEKYALSAYRTQGSASYQDIGSGVSVPADFTINEIYIRINHDYAIPSGGLTFYPMLRLATITDPTFAPYIPSVESRIEAVESGLTNIVKDITNTVTLSSGVSSARVIKVGNMVFISAIATASASDDLITGLPTCAIKSVMGNVKIYGTGTTLIADAALNNDSVFMAYATS